MLKLLIVFPVVVAIAVLVGVGSLVLIPLAALLPLLLGVGAAIFAGALALGIIVVIFRLLAAIVFGVGGVLVAGAGFIVMSIFGVMALVLGVLFAHLLLPIFLIGGLIWLIARGSRHARQPAQITAG